MKKLRLAGAALGALLVVVVILQNTVPVTVKFLLMEFTLPNAVLMGVTWLVGLTTGFVLALNGYGSARPKPDNTLP